MMDTDTAKALDRIADAISLLAAAAWHDMDPTWKRQIDEWMMEVSDLFPNEETLDSEVPAE